MSLAQRVTDFKIANPNKALNVPRLRKIYKEARVRCMPVSKQDDYSLNFGNLSIGLSLKTPESKDAISTFYCSQAGTPVIDLATSLFIKP